MGGSFEHEKLNKDESNYEIAQTLVIVYILMNSYCSFISILDTYLLSARTQVRRYQTSYTNLTGGGVAQWSELGI